MPDENFRIPAPRREIPPVEKDWTTSSGLRAVVLIGPTGKRCGYVGIPDKHPLYGCNYHEQSPVLKVNLDRSTEKMSPWLVFCSSGKKPEELNTPEMVLEVHGGITFSNRAVFHPNVEDSPETPLWWFGYDCAHACDEDDPKDLSYCEAECESLATQLWLIHKNYAG